MQYHVRYNSIDPTQIVHNTTLHMFSVVVFHTTSNWCIYSLPFLRNTVSNTTLIDPTQIVGNTTLHMFYVVVFHTTLIDHIILVFITRSLHQSLLLYWIWVCLTYPSLNVLPVDIMTIMTELAFLVGIFSGWLIVCQWRCSKFVTGRSMMLIMEIKQSWEVFWFKHRCVHFCIIKYSHFTLSVKLSTTYIT